MLTKLEILRGKFQGNGAVWISEATMRELIDAILADRARLPQTSGTESPDPGGRGRWFLIEPGGAGSGAHAFQLIDASEGETHSVRVRYGTVNGIIPTGMSEGDSPEYVLPVTGSSGFVYLVVSAAVSGIISSVSIDTDAAMPADEDATLIAEGTYHLQIGSFSVIDDVFHLAQNISGSQVFELCGGVEPLWGLI